MSVQDDLTRIEAAIAAIETGGAVEEFGEGSQRIRAARLAELYAERRQLRKELAAESGSFRYGEVDE